MEFIIIFALIVIAVLLWNGYRTRCPNCGHTSIHKRDKVAEAESIHKYKSLKEAGLLDAFDRIDPKFGTAKTRPGFVNHRFRCPKCSHMFDRASAIEWLKIANTLGEQRAISEYQKVRSGAA